MVWQMKKLGDLCQTSAGGTPLKSNNEYYENGDIPWLMSGEVANRNITYSKNFITERGLKNSSAKIFPVDSVLIAMYGATAGEVGILRFEASTNQAVCGIFPSENFLPEFLYYYFLSYKMELVAQAVGNAQPNISQQKIKETFIPVPSIAEQKQIVAILDEAFANIDDARQLAERNLINARQLFDSTLNQIFTQRSDGWQIKTLASVCQIKPPKKEAREKLAPDDLVSFVPMDCLQKNRKELKLDQVRSLDDVSGSYTYFADGDVLLAKITPCFENGKLGIARELKNGVGFGSSEYIVFRCCDALMPDFLYYFLDRPAFRDEGKALMVGAVGHKRVAKDFIENYKIPFPCPEEQQAIVCMFDALRVEVGKLEKIYQQKITALDELKQSLLQKAFRGELTQKQAAA